MITPSTPRSNCRSTRSAQRSGEPVAAGSSHSSGINDAMCSSVAVSALSSIEPRKRRHDRVAAEPLEHSRIPVVRLDEQVAVALQVGRHPPDGLLQPQLLGQAVVDRRVARPDTDRRRIAAGLLGGLPHGRRRTARSSRR